MGIADFIRWEVRKAPNRATQARRVAIDVSDRTPHQLRKAARRWPLPSTQLVCVYRYNNHAHVEAILQNFEGRAALWALDTTHPTLASKTCGSGPGSRFSLLNRLIGELPEDGSHLVITDDDVTFAPGSLATLVKTSAHFGIDLAQPAHGPLSHCSFDFNRFQRGVIGRRTMWVEIGPTVVFGPKARAELLPLPENSTMGWGQEAVWHQAAKNGLALGIIDGVRMRHRGYIAAAYDLEAAEAEDARALAKYGLTSQSEMQMTISRLEID
jgi:hypothetical protein